ncbi:hypothetical protein FB468_3129 [Leucobacter komagatae]|uniref:THUMP-like domain-containing protein n=2 Tax=Leucobacter komagatae TaxID=55969 RepID=A0A542XXQ6_9MICO|nr:hypothetical protein FB468_3129 [Leucobacter komagatae]
MHPGPVSSSPGWDGLTTPDGHDLLGRIAALRAAGDAPDLVNQRLRKDGADPELLAAALTVAGLRDRAAPKFGANAPDMLFTQAGLEQASRAHVAELHAARFASCKAVADLGCGLGAESLAFLRAGKRVRAVELDPLTARFAEHNLAVEARGLAAAGGSPEFDVLVGDATVVGAGDADAVFLDPARRTAGHRDTRRLASSDDYSPTLDFAFRAARSAVAGGVKLGPGLDRELIPSDAEAQWVSVDGQVVEMGLWFGEAARAGVGRSATLVSHDDGPLAAPTVHELRAATDAPDAEARELGEYLFEPDGAVIRARLIGLLAKELGAGMLREGIAYLTADRPAHTPFAQAFRVIEELPAREKDLKRALAARGIGRLEIKKRGVDVDPAALRTRMRLKGPHSATLILSRSANRHVALLAERC